jgi:predicted DNA-binding transcriptional regulator AlpA
MAEYLHQYEPLLNEKQVAELSGFSPRTLQTWRLRGGGPKFLKLGSCVRYSRGDVVAWLQDSVQLSTSDAKGRS